MSYLFITSASILCIYYSLGQFCDSNENINSVFDLGQNTFFGLQDTEKLWKYSAKENKVYDKQIEIVDLFGKNVLKMIISAVTFDVKVPCNESNEELCKNSVNFSNLVLVFGRSDNNKMREITNYVSYRLKNDQTLEQIIEGEIVWGLKPSGTMKENFWPKGDYKYRGFTFDKTRLFAIVDSKAGDQIIYNQINSNGSFDAEWNVFKTLENKKYLGVFDINGYLYALGKFNDAHQYSISGPLKEYTLKVLLNCNGNLKPTVIQTIQTIQTTQTQFPTDSTSNTINSSAEKSSSLWWVFVFIALLILITISIAVFLMLYRKLKVNKREVQSEESENTQLNSSTASPSSVSIRTTTDSNPWTKKGVKNVNFDAEKYSPSGISIRSAKS